MIELTSSKKTVVGVGSECEKQTLAPTSDLLRTRALIQNVIADERQVSLFGYINSG